MSFPSFLSRGLRYTDRPVLAIVLWLAFPVSVSRGADSADLAAKDVFTVGFPQGLAFRGEMSRPLHRDYAAWSGALRDQAGVIRKFTTEELPKIYPESIGWAARFAQEHPEKLMLLHLNGEGRQVTTEAAVHQRYFPGHWVYQPGSVVTNDLTAEADEFTVAEIGPFKVDAYLDRGDNEDGKHWFPQMLCLVAVDENGKRDWHRSEFVVVTKVDRARRTVAVKRGQLFSKARSHGAGRTYAAPLAAGVWGGAPMAYYNLSSACPKDAQGRSAADIFRDEIAGWFSANGPLGRFNGVAFDVNYWVVRDASWDVDNDGRSDGGIVAGVNVWRMGDWKFLSELRAALGEQRIITADAQLAANQQAVGLLDGIESEGLVQHNDGFRGFSRAVNTHLYWQENNPRPRDFRYVVLKLKNPADEKRADQLRRFAVGAASVLGARTTAIPVGVLPPDFATPGSLGMPAGGLIRPVRVTPDLLKGAGLSALEAKDCVLTPSATGDGLDIAPASEASPMVVTLRNLAVPAGDVTVFVEMQALDPLEGFSSEAYVPRMVRAAFSKLPTYGEGRYDSYYTDLYGFMGTHRRSVLSFYLRRPNLPAQTLDVRFSIEGRGRARVFELTAHSGADVLVRRFTKGVVVVNPAFEPQAVELAATPRVGSSAARVVVPPLDAVFLTRGD
jgi:hypothetical protein